MSDPAARQGMRGRAGVVLAIVCSAQLILAVDITIILVADVQIKHALGFSEASLSWIVTAYALTFGGLLLLAGRLCDSFGHRRMFLLGMAAFGVASACAALSADPLELVLSRAAQGIAASMVSPAALALLGDEFTHGPRRSRAFGFWAASGSAGGVIGYTVGGVLVGYLGWRWAFIINLPITAAGIAAGRRYLPARAVPASRRRLPVLGAASVTVGLGLLIYALGEGQSAGWASATTLALIAGAALCIAAFVIHEARSPDPLIALAVIRRRESAASVVAALQAATISAAVYLGSLYLQQVLGDSPQRVGIATLPVPLGVAAGAYTVTRLLRHGRGSRFSGTALVVCRLRPRRRRARVDRRRGTGRELRHRPAARLGGAGVRPRRQPGSAGRAGHLEHQRGGARRRCRRLLHGATGRYRHRPGGIQRARRRVRQRLSAGRPAARPAGRNPRHVRAGIGRRRARGADPAARRGRQTRRGAWPGSSSQTPAGVSCRRRQTAPRRTERAQLRGMPSTSSPMTLSCISSVPPPMSVGGTDR